MRQTDKQTDNRRMETKRGIQIKRQTGTQTETETEYSVLPLE